MNSQFFRIGIVLAVPLIIVSIIVLKGLFFSPHTNLEDYKMHEKELGKLFDKYEKESETMTQQELISWTYSDVFRLDTSFEDSLPKEARQYFKERQQRLAFEYVNRLHSVLQDTPTEHRADTLRIVRETLSKNLDRDFADSVIKQLQSDSK